MALVTGAGHGIGLAVARRLLRDGYCVVLAERDSAAGKAAAAALGEPERVLFMKTDVAKEAEVRRAVAKTVAVFGGLDVLVSNAGLADPVTGPLAKLGLAEWNRYLAVNLTGALLCAKHAAPHLSKRRGAIINMSSTRALMSEPRTEAYAATKGALDALTHALAVSLAPHVRVNSIRPGWIHTGKGRLSAAAHKQHLVGRVGVPEDIAGVVAFLAGRDAAFITGQCLVADGGMTRKMIYDE